MKTLSKEAFAAAERYLVLNARLIDRLRFEYLFDDGDPGPVRRALLAYRGADGGFGHALEPDLRGAVSQPQHIEVAFWILDEIYGFGDPAVRGACDWLDASSTGEGGVPWVLPSVVEAERAPWWQPEGDQPPASINPTGAIAGLLHAHGVDHPWLERATAFSWRKIAELQECRADDAKCVLAFLERAPDRERAEAEFARMAERLRGAAALDPAAEGYVHSPLDLAPRPDSMANRLFTEEEIDLHLDALIDAQQDDGGWRPNFEMWAPAVVGEWGGFLTVAQLGKLRAYGRIA